MKKEWIVERNGRSFVLYAGLLDLAHERGLKAITTSLVQVPVESNRMMAICFATVETEQGTFTGLGDASPENVSRMMVPHLIRMAETRAKARALRDAVNVGVTAFEELGELGEVDEPDAAEQPLPVAPARPAAVKRGLRSLDPVEAPSGPPASVAGQANGAMAMEDSEPAGAGADAGVVDGPRPVRPDARTDAPPATPKQVQTIARMARVAGKTFSTEGLSRAQASEIISSLIGEVDQLRAS